MKRLEEDGRFKYVAGDADGNIEISPCCALKPVSSSTQLRPPPSPCAVLLQASMTTTAAKLGVLMPGVSRWVLHKRATCVVGTRDLQKTTSRFLQKHQPQQSISPYCVASLRCLRLGTYELYSWGGGGTLLVLGMPSPRFPPRFFPPFEAAVHRSELGVPKSTS